MASLTREAVGVKNRRFTLELPSQTVVSGVATPVWTTIATIWGEFEGLGGTLLGTTAELDARIRVWYRTDITARCRLGLSGTTRKFALQAPPRDPTGRKDELILAVREITA